MQILWISKFLQKKCWGFSLLARTTMTQLSRVWFICSYISRGNFDTVAIVQNFNGGNFDIWQFSVRDSSFLFAKTNSVYRWKTIIIYQIFPSNIWRVGISQNLSLQNFVQYDIWLLENFKNFSFNITTLLFRETANQEIKPKLLKFSKDRC